MPVITEYLERLFSVGHSFTLAVAKKWHYHSNRRSILILIIGGLSIAVVYLQIIQPPDDFPLETLVSVPEGMSVREVSEKLQSDNVVRSAVALRTLVRFMGSDRNVRAGDYMFKEPKNVFAVARALSIGQFGLEPFRVRIHEGAMTKEMAAIFDARLERFDAEDFLSEAKTLEGYLFPDTYFFMPNATEDTVIEAMRQNFDRHMQPLQSQVASSSRSLDEIVKMASIVEREARNSEDRKMIAGVLWNRIDRGMALQVDVTFLYTIGKGTFHLTMADLVSDSPYNTYRFKGLPPTAIGSPSLDSLTAALTPTKNDFLFYLADNSGVTHFSKTYAEHLRKKRLYLGT